MRSRIAVVLLLVAGVVLFWALQPATSALALGKPVPDFSLPGETGQTVRLADFRGKLLLINFWSTTCGPCIEEIPSLNSLQRAYGSRGLAIVGINEDGTLQQMSEDLGRFRKKVPIEFPIAFDGDGSLADVYGTFRLPETYLVDKHGILLRKVVGSIDWSNPTVLADLEKSLPK